MITYAEMMERCLSYIEEHLEEDFSLRELAEYCGYSFHHFCHVFSVCSGCSVGDYIRRRRLQEAGKKLKAGDMVTSVAFEAGFDTVSGFSRAFKKEYGVSASDFRRRYSGEGITVALKELPERVMVGYPIFPGGDIDEEAVGAYWHGNHFQVVSDEDYARVARGSSEEAALWERPLSRTGELCYFYGPVVYGEVDIPEGMFRRVLPGGLYAVFTTAPADLSADNASFAAEIRRGWRYIYGRWLDEYGRYVFDDDGVAYEYYSADYGGLRSKDVVMDICVPVRDRYEDGPANFRKNGTV